jgi:hypothetical protein
MMVAAESGEAEDPWTGHGHMNARIGYQVSLLEEIGVILQNFGSRSSTQNRNLLWVCRSMIRSKYSRKYMAQSRENRLRLR